MPHKKQRDCNENWEAEIARYDTEQRRADDEYRKSVVVVGQSGNHPDLDDDEQEILTLVLNGVSIDEIARQCEVEPHVVEGYIEIIRAKLSLE